MVFLRQIGDALRRQDRWWLVLVLVLYLLLVLIGITNSSIALLDDPSDGTQGLLVGDPRPIRSDEWIKATPQLIGQLAQGDGSFMPSLATPVETGGTSAAGPVSAILSAEYLLAGQVSRWDLDAGIALAWWFPAVLFAVGLPALMRRFEVPVAWGITAVILIAFSPANAWWSWIPVRVTAYAVVAAAGAAAATAAFGRRRRIDVFRGVLGVLLSGVMLAKLAVSYTPWVVTIGIPVLSATMAWLIWRRAAWRTALMVIAVSAVLGIALTVGYLAENRDFFQALASTVYPGSRQVVGRFVGLPLLLGAPQLWYLQKPAAVVTATNASELSSAYTVFSVVVVVAAAAYALLSLTTGRSRLPRHSLALGLPAVVLLLWCTVTFPEQATSFPLLNRVPPERVAQVVGIPLTMLAIIALTGLRRTTAKASTRLLGLVAGAATFAVLAPSASHLQTVNIPELPIWSIWAVSAAWGIGIALIVGIPQRVWPLAPVCALAIGSTIFVNPAQQGTADLRNSDAAMILATLQDRMEPGQRVAVSDPFAGAILMANSVPMVNGYQGAPNEDAWRLLDPTLSYEQVWNRGASLVQFEWLGDGDALEIVTPQADVVTIRADPCDPALDSLRLGALVAAGDLGDRQCLRSLGTVSMAGQPKWVFLRE